MSAERWPRWDQILVVDDDADTSRLVRRVLGPGCSEVRGGGSLSEARGLLDAETFDLVIVDLRLGEESGLPLLADIRSRAREGRRPMVLALTDEEGDDDAAWASGVDDLLFKPLCARSLQSRLVSLGRQRSLLQLEGEPRRSSRQRGRQTEDVVFGVDRDGVVSAVHSVAEDLCDGEGVGSSRVDWLGDVLPRSWPEMFREAVPGKSFCLPLRVGHDPPRSFEATVSAMPGTPESFLVVARDRTREHILQENIRGTREFLNNLVRSSADAIVATDEKGRITFFSPGAEEIFGFESKAIRGHRVSDYYRGAVATARQIMTELLQHEKLRNLDVQFRHANGPMLQVSLSGSLLRNGEGQVIGTLGVLKDVSRERRRASNDARAGAMAARGDLAAEIGHQLRNFLSVVQGRSERLRQKLEHGDRSFALGDLVAMEREFCKMETLSAELMNLTRPKAPEPGVEVGETLEILVESLQRCARFREHQISVDLPASPLWAEISGRDLEAIVINLLENAADASPAGVPIELMARELDSHSLMLEVRDHGAGIPAGLEESILTKRFTTKPDGHGLGLSIVQRLVRAHRGKLEFYAHPSGGTTFRMTLLRLGESVATGPAEVDVPLPLDDGRGTLQPHIGCQFMNKGEGRGRA